MADVKSDRRPGGWLDPKDFPVCQHLEAHAGVILDELRRVASMKVWSVWKEGPYAPTGELTHVGEGEPCWRLFGLYLRGKPIGPHCRLCPETARVLAQVPRLTKAGFSCLEAGYAMEPHLGHDPKNFRVHLGLIVPEGDCGMSVNGEARRWEAGRATIFDDTFVHAAWNRAASHRFVLIADILNDRAG
jgi:beta-hydroxylase